MVIPVPVPFRIQGNQKHVAAFQVLKYRLTVFPVQDMIAQGSGNLFQNGSFEEKIFDSLCLCSKDLFDEIIHDITVVPCQSLNKT